MIRDELSKIYLKKLRGLFPNVKTPLHYRTDFQLLVSVILSAQSTDRQVNKVTKDLFSMYTTVNDFAGCDIFKLENYIKSIGLFRTKATYIKKSAQIIKNKYKGAVPLTFNDLLSLPGVGRKTANVILFELTGKSEGIAVDTHVLRLSQILALTNNSDPISVEKDLMQIIPKVKWGTFSLRMIFYGRKLCPADKQNIPSCIVGEINPDNPYKDCPLSVELSIFFKKMPIGVVGVSHNPQKYGARIFKTLLHQGYKVNGINPGGGVVENIPLFKSSNDFLKRSGGRDVLLIFVVPPTISQRVLDNIKGKHVSIWFQPGSYDNEIIKKSLSSKREIFFGKCFMKLNGLW